MVHLIWRKVFFLSSSAIFHCALLIFPGLRILWFVHIRRFRRQYQFRWHKHDLLLLFFPGTQRTLSNVFQHRITIRFLLHDLLLESEYHQGWQFHLFRLRLRRVFHRSGTSNKLRSLTPYNRLLSSRSFQGYVPKLGFLLTHLSQSFPFHLRKASHMSGTSNSLHDRIRYSQLPSSLSFQDYVRQLEFLLTHLFQSFQLHLKKVSRRSGTSNMLRSLTPYNWLLSFLLFPMHDPVPQFLQAD